MNEWTWVFVLFIIVSVYAFTNAFIYPAVVETLIRSERLIRNCKLKTELAWVHIASLKTTADSTIFLDLVPRQSTSQFTSAPSSKPPQTKRIASFEKNVFILFYSRHMAKTKCWKIETKSDQARRNRTKSVQIKYILWWFGCEKMIYCSAMLSLLKYGKWLSMLNSVDELLTFFPTHILYFCTWRKHTWHCTSNWKKQKG